MKNIALIIAGGSGQRMHQDIPKQFLNVYDKPVILYTLEDFQRHPNIDGIVVVCIEGWEAILSAYCRQFNITKLESIVPGGKNGQDSIRNGVYDIASRHDDDDLILVHDAIRPMVSEEIISDNIRVASKYPNIAKEYFYNRKHQTVDIIKLNGSVELGPIVELADVIDDIVETGSTLKANRLEVLEEVLPISARMIVNQVSMQMKTQRIRDMIDRVRDCLV